MPKMRKPTGPIRTRTNPATGKPMVGRGKGPNYRPPTSAEVAGAPYSSIGGSAGIERPASKRPGAKNYNK